MAFQGKKILVSRTDKLGDLVISIPFAKFIKLNYPNSEIIFLVRKGNGIILKGNKYINRVVEVDVFGERGELVPSEYINLFFLLHKIKPDFLFVLFPRFSISFVFFLFRLSLPEKEKMPEIIGTSRRIYSFLFSKKVDISRRKNLYHEAYYNLLLISPFVDIQKKLAEKILFSELRPEIFVEEERKKIFSFLEGKRYVVFHPLSGGSAPNFEMSFWYSIAYEFTKIAGIHAVFVGKSKDEKAIIHELEKVKKKYRYNKLLSKIIFLINRTSLTDLCYVIKNSECVISPASGPIHIASALGKKTVGIYTKDEIVRWRPLGESFIIDVDKRYVLSRGKLKLMKPPFSPYYVAKKIADFINPSF